MFFFENLLPLILFCILSAFFSGIETALYRISDLDIVSLEKSSKKRERSLAKLLNKRETLLTTILIGNNLTNIIAGAYTAAVAINLAGVFGLSQEIMLSIGVAVLTTLILVFGEILPKSLAIYYSKPISLFFTPVIYVINFLFTPVTYIFYGFLLLVNLVLKPKKLDYQIDDKTLLNIVYKGNELGVFKENEKKIIENTLSFNDIEAGEVMTPRTKVFCLQKNMTVKQTIPLIVDKGFSRIPIFSDNKDNIIGVVHYKDIFREFLNKKNDKKLSEVAKEPIFIYQKVKILNVFEEFKAKQNHFGIVVDDFGGVDGIITMEDLMEEIMGDILDEKDKHLSRSLNPTITELTKNKWLVSGNVDIYTFNKTVQANLEYREPYDTLQGLIMYYLKSLPKVGDALRHGDFLFKVTHINKNEIKIIAASRIETS